MLSVIITYAVMRTWLRILFLRHRRKVAALSGVSLVGSALLATGVMVLNLDPRLVNLVLSPTMMIFGFFIVKQYGFPDREIARLPGLGKWALKWAVMLPISQAYFAWLVQTHDMQFMVARVVVGTTTFMPSFAFVTLVVFARRGLGVRRTARTVRTLALRSWAFGTGNP